MVELSAGAGIAPPAYVKGQLYMLPIGEIQTNPNQPRKYFDVEAQAVLAGSVQERGVLQPILVRLVKEGHIELVAGERRLKAALEAGLTEIPALFTDDNPEEVAMIENSLRQNLTAVEEAEAANRLVGELNYTPEQLQKILGKKRQTIADILSLNRLPAEIRDECRINPTCPRRVLVEIARKKQERAMISLYRKYKEKGLTSDEIRAEAKKERTEKTTEEQAAAVLTGIAALHTRLDKIDWLTVSIDDRAQIQDAFAALADTFKTIVEADPKVVA